MDKKSVSIFSPSLYLKNWPWFPSHTTATGQMRLGKTVTEFTEVCASHKKHGSRSCPNVHHESQGALGEENFSFCDFWLFFFLWFCLWTEYNWKNRLIFRDNFFCWNYQAVLVFLKASLFVGFKKCQKRVRTIKTWQHLDKSTVSRVWSVEKISYTHAPLLYFSAWCFTTSALVTNYAKLPHRSRAV